ncbi:MAG: MMPL family transporter [Desulfobacterales bacterium]|uniref:MMPL family transporter n=1 Tax=Candidatus Desulfatibia vada TaxID=2841696 RepID=A0A8J6TL59_9BACT|nr:MMPL family transporter [Candidatus Desulfatibia vada]
MDKLEKMFGSMVIKQRWWIIVATVLIVAAAGGGMQHLKFNNDTRVFFSKENPQLQALEALENTYNKTNNVLFAIAPKNGDVFTRETLAAVEELTELLWQMPYSSRVNSITNFQHTRAQEDDLIVEDLVQGAGNLSDDDLLRIKRIALSEPLLMNRLLSPAGHVTGVSVIILAPGKSLNETPKVAAFARKIADDFRKKHPGIKLYLTGGVMMDNAFGEAGLKDMTTLVPLMLLTLVVIVGLSLRSFAGTFATLIIILISMVTGMGMAGWLRIMITAASSSAPTIILTLAVADSVHVLATIFQQIHQGNSKYEAIAESVRINLQPIFLTSITTVIGFLTMNFSDAPPFRDLGNIVAMGVSAAFVYSVLFLPALMAVIPVRVKPKPDEAVCAGCDRLASFVINRRKVVFWGSLVVIVALTAGMLRIELNDNWIKYFDKSYDIRRASDFTEENLTGFHIIEYSLESGETGGINNPDFLTTVAKFAGWYRQQSKVVNVNTITDTMKRLNKNMHADDESYYRIPEERNLAAQYLLLYEMSLPFGLDLNNQINVDKSATRMIVTLKDTSTTELRATDENARAWLQANAPQSMFTYGSGLSVIWAHLSQRNINSMLGASFVALVLISAILTLALRSLKLGLVSLIPNLTPALMAYGIWGLTVGQVGLGLSVIAAMTLGIVVDDTVHFMSKYIRARREHNLNPAGAVRYAFNTVGTAMWITTLALVAGFMVLALSGYNMNADMGLLSALTISLALILDFLFLPTLLMKVEGKKYELLDKKANATTIDRHDSVFAPVSVGSSSRDS